MRYDQITDFELQIFGVLPAASRFNVLSELFGTNMFVWYDPDTVRVYGMLVVTLNLVLLLKMNAGLHTQQSTKSLE
jgi:hypothetical protein